MVFLQKIGLSLALFFIGFALQFAGFKESIPGQPIPTQSELAVFAIRMAIGPLPTIILICGLALAYYYPITREVHAEILLKLRERKQENKNSENREEGV